MSQNKQRRQLTDQQRQAIDVKDSSIVLSAGAGCGKTTVLTQRFLSHLEPGPHAYDLSRLVAITFTERAAREMRDRIREQCLERLLSCDADQVDHWKEIVRGLDSARINTIHGFCASLLRMFAVEAELDPKFNLLDEMSGETFLNNAVESALHQLLANDDDEAAELVYEFGLSTARELLKGLVQQRFRLGGAAWESMSVDELIEFWDDQWKTQAVPRMRRELYESPVVQTLLELLKSETPSNPKMQDRWRIMSDRIPRLIQDDELPPLLAEIREAAMIRGAGTKKDWPDAEVYELLSETLEGVRKQIDKLAGMLEVDPTYGRRGAEIGLCAVRVAQRVGERYDRAKSEKGVLDFDDLLLRARNLLRDFETVRRRVDSGISLLMVDEFQDTDPIQDEIVKKLCGDNLTSGKLFVVGDVKQSIYRFRRAEPRVFEQLAKVVPKRGNLPLNRNYRSVPEILTFVNCLFDGALGSEYQPLEPPAVDKSPETKSTDAKPAVVGQNEKADRDHPAHIEFLFAVPGNDEQADDDDEEKAHERRQREGRWIARRLRQLIDSQELLIRDRANPGGMRAVRPGDVVILFRAMTDVRYYEQELRDQGLDCYVVGGRAFFAQQEIFDVVNLCQFLNNVDDEVSLIGVLRSPFFSLSDDSIAALGRHPAAALNEEPPAHLTDRQQELIRFAGGVLRELREKKDRLPLAQLLNLAIELTGYDAALLTEFLGERKLANLRKLVDMARQIDQSGLFTLADFVAQLKNAVAEETHEPLAATHPESSNVIRLMSIHQSKGLEYPVVVIADMNRRGANQMDRGHIDPTLGPVVNLPKKFGVERKHPAQFMLRLEEDQLNLDETRRLLYVAATRAADLLILSANFEKPGVLQHPWLKLLAERFDLQTGQQKFQARAADGRPIIQKYSWQGLAIRVHQKMPEVTANADGRGSATNRTPLTNLRESIEKAAPQVLPDKMRVIEPHSKSPRRLSVSQIEEIDRRARGRTFDEQRAPVVDRPQESEAEPASPEERQTALSKSEQLGTLVHQALERINFAQPQDVSNIVERCEHSGGRAIDEKVKTLAELCVRRLLDSPLGKELAIARSIHREIDFLLTVPQLVDGALQETEQKPGETSGEATGASIGVISGTIDALVENDQGEWLVFDYKTGDLGSHSDEQKLLDAYDIQLGIYSLAIRQYLGRLPTRVDLVFFRPEVRRISFEPTEERLIAVWKRTIEAFEKTADLRAPLERVKLDLT